MPTRTMMGTQDRHARVWLGGLAMVAGLLVVGSPAARAQQAAPAEASHAPQAADAPADSHTPAPADHATPPAGDHAAQPAADHGGAPAGDHAAAASHGAAEAEHGAEHHEESIWVTLARVANFAILVGVIYWFARKPFAAHLASRGAQIRKDLVDAAEMRATATARLADIEARLAALPGELDQLRRRGAEELEAERTRMRVAAEAERDRLVEQARREIASQTRTARAELRAHAAELAIDVAEARLRATLTPAEQVALVDTYAAQMRNVQ